MQSASATGLLCGLLCGLQALDERTIGHNPERLCLLKGGIVYSNAVTTVSPNYAHETLQGGQGRRCRRARANALHGRRITRRCMRSQRA